MKECRNWGGGGGGNLITERTWKEETKKSRNSGNTRSTESYIMKYSAERTFDSYGILSRSGPKFLRLPYLTAGSREIRPDEIRSSGGRSRCTRPSSSRPPGMHAGLSQADRLGPIRRLKTVKTASIRRTLIKPTAVSLVETCSRVQPKRILCPSQLLHPAQVSMTHAMVVAFSSLARTLGECSTIHSPPVSFFFFLHSRD